MTTFLMHGKDGKEYVLFRRCDSATHGDVVLIEPKKSLESWNIGRWETSRDGSIGNFTFRRDPYALDVLRENACNVITEQSSPGIFTTKTLLVYSPYARRKVKVPYTSGVPSIDSGEPRAPENCSIMAGKKNWKWRRK